MEHILNAKNRIINYCKDNPKLSSALLATAILYTINKARNKYRYSQKEFTTSIEINNKAILITGCGHGFGHDLALQLAIDHGYHVIATCRTQLSADELLSNSKFVANKSTAVMMDVTNDKHINDTKQFVIKYLDETNATLWAIVNNAGLGFAVPFEMCPAKYDTLIRDVLVRGPINIIREFLPLLHGRKNYKKDTNNTMEMTANGGRVVNISSIGARCCMSDVRYGPSKAAISYATHALRKELSPRFGIWCSTIEPGGFQTNIMNTGLKWSERIVEELKENGKEELLDIYDYDLDVVKELVNKFVDKYFAEDYQPVLDDIIHALTAKYPMREYIPGRSLMLTILEKAPLSVWDAVSLKQKREWIATIKAKQNK